LPRELIENTLTAARLSDTSAERVSLMTAALTIVERNADVLPSDWRTEVRQTTRANIALEIETDRVYQSLSDRMLNTATTRARNADVRGLERLLLDIKARDQMLGARRPEAINALVESVEVKLNAARELRLARDRYALREADFRKYRASMAGPIQRFEGLKAALEDIKALAGSSPWTLGSLERGATEMLKSMAAVVPPEEFQSAHALLVSSAQMADSAAKIRREAALTGSMPRAWDASAAAAGALMLNASARSEILALLRLPQLTQ
jgi:hypothetical protein